MTKTKKNPNPTIECVFFSWILYQRNNQIWQADGRSNQIDCGRHSLGTLDFDEAKKEATELDKYMAVKHGLADASILEQDPENSVEIAAGCHQFLDYCQRPAVMGGLRKSSVKRYRAVFDKFKKYYQEVGLEYWHQIRKPVLEDYGVWLAKRGYAPKTLQLELASLKSVNIWLIDRGQLSEKCRIKMRLKKISGSKTYCWKPEEVKAILNYCQADPNLHWLWRALSTLAMTGMRIAEICSLKWSDIDFLKRVISLKDESDNNRLSASESRTTKSGQDRLIPINDQLWKILSEMDQEKVRYIFKGPLGGRLKPDTVRRIMVRDVLMPLADQFPTPDGEVGFTDGRLHSFRHFFCSQCANKGVPERVLMSWVGHSDSRMVKHYYHLHDIESQQQMNQIDLLN